MNDRHLTYRGLRKQHGFAWGRVPNPSEFPRAVQYRLFIRDSANVCHSSIRLFTVDEIENAREGGRKCIARHLRAMKAQLRWRVDRIEFARLGLEDTTPAPRAYA